MFAKVERKRRSRTEPVGSEADQLRSLVSAMLSGTYKEELYLWDVASLCRGNPRAARELLALIDRYQRLGQMPAAQHSKIRERIEQALTPRAPHTAAPAPVAAASTAPAAGPAAATPPAAAAPGPSPRSPAEPVDTASTAAPAPVAAAPSAAAPSAAAPSAAGPPAAAPDPTRQRRATAAPREAPGPNTTSPLPGAEPCPSDPVPTLQPAAAAAANATDSNGPAAPLARTDSVKALPADLAERLGLRSHAAPTAEAAEAAPSGARPTDAPASAAAAADSIGTGSVLRGRYELQEVLGYGGMASVYKAFDRYRASLGLADCHVALKLVTARPGRTSELLALGREFHHAQQLSHPNVVNVYEIDHEGGASFYTMELLEGERLSQLIERIGGALPLPYALALLRDVGAAVSHAHSRGVVHADLKPHNIFVTYGGQVRVLDFGHVDPPMPAAAAAGFDPAARAGPAAGARAAAYRTATPAYASCEQLQGQGVDTRDDVYSLACMGYEVITGQHPFGGLSALEARAQRLRPRRPAVLGAAAWRALRRGLAWEREHRPRHLPTWLAELGVAGAAGHLPPSHELRAAQAPRLGMRRVAAAAILLVITGTVAFALLAPGAPGWRASWSAARATLQSAAHEVRSRWSGGAASPPPAAVTSSSAPVTAAPEARTAAASTATTPPATPATPSAPPTAGPRTHARLDARRSAAGRTARHRVARSATLSRAAPGNEVPASTDTPLAAPPAPRTASSATAAAASLPTATPLAPQPIVRSGPPGVTFAATRYNVSDDAPAARILVHRTGSLREPLHFVWWTEDDTAKAEVDYAPLGRRTEQIPSGQDALTIFVPIISNPLRHGAARFYVALGAVNVDDPRVASERASVTIEHGD